MKKNPYLGPSLIIASAIIFIGNRLYQGIILLAFSNLSVIPEETTDPASISIFILSLLLFFIGIFFSLERRNKQ